MSTQKTAVIYARVSTKRQADDELPIESQVQQCKAKAEDLGARVDRVFIDHGISGRNEDRRAFQDAIEFCEISSPDYLITWSTSRFTRDKVHAGIYKLRLAKAGTDIVYASMAIDRESDAGWMTEGMLELFDEFYSRQVSADTIRSQIKNARDGYFNGGRAPFGYESYPAPDNPKRKRLRPVDAEAIVVREMFELRTKGLGALSISVELQSRSITNRGKSWTKSSVLALLRNEAMIGRIIFGRRDRATRRIQPRDKWIVIDAHEPILDIALWDAVQGAMDTATAGTEKGSPHSSYLFTGLLRCEENGSSMQIESAKGRSKRYWYYNCRDHQKKGIGRPRRIAAAEFDEWLLSVILDRILTAEFLTDVLKDLNDACGTWVRDHKKRRQSVASSLQASSQKNEKIYELFEELGKDTPNLGDLTRRLRANNADVSRLEQQLTAIDAEEQPELSVSERDIADLAATMRYIIETAENPKKLRHFFGRFISSIWVGDDSVRIEYRPECLISNPEPVAVPSKANWLLGTGSNRRPSD